MTRNELIDALQSAEGPHRGLDVQLTKHVLGRTVGVAAFTKSIDAAVGLVEQTLPGWSWRVATCCVSDDAWLQPDFNCPIHGERLKRELDESTDWVELTDVDLRPSGRPAMALCMSLLMALDAVARTSQDKGEPTNG